METGFSTKGGWNSCGTAFLSEGTQEDFVNVALPIILGKVTDHNSAFPDTSVLLANWYELLDSSVGIIPEERHFGILREDWTTKLPYDDLEVRIAEFDL